jgi:hypothetical protein
VELVMLSRQDGGWFRQQKKSLWLLGLIPLLPVLFLGFFGDDWVALDSYGPGGWELAFDQLAPRGGEFYRPLGFFLLQLEIVVTAGNPAIIHGIHLALFTFAAWLTGVLAQRIARASIGPWVAMLALVYPGRIEAGMWMIAIFDLLAMILVVIGLILFVAPEDRDSRAAIMLVAFLAPAAKEVGFVLPLVMMAWSVLGVTPGSSTRRRITAAWIGAGAAVGLRLAAFGGIGGYTGVDVFQQAAYRSMLLPKVVMSALFAPVNTSLGPPAILIGGISACVICGAAIGLARCRERRGSRQLAVAGGTLALITLLPALPFLNQHVVWNHSRFMALPAVGVVLVVSALLICGDGVRRGAFWSIFGVWSVVTVLNLTPWFEGAKAQAVILDKIEITTQPTGHHTIWLDGPIGGFSGNHLFGGHLPSALRVRFPDRDIDSDSRFFQRLQGREQGPPDKWRGTLHVLKFVRTPPQLKEIGTYPPEASADVRTEE